MCIIIMYKYSNNRKLTQNFNASIEINFDEVEMFKMHKLVKPFYNTGNRNLQLFCKH